MKNIFSFSQCWVILVYSGQTRKSSSMNIADLISYTYRAFIKTRSGRVLEILGSYPMYITHNNHLIEDFIYFASEVTNMDRFCGRIGVMRNGKNTKMWFIGELFHITAREFRWACGFYIITLYCIVKILALWAVSEKWLLLSFYHKMLLMGLFQILGTVVFSIMPNFDEQFFSKKRARNEQLNSNEEKLWYSWSWSTVSQSHGKYAPLLT